MNTATALNTYDVAHHDGGLMFAGDDKYYPSGWYVYDYDGHTAIRVDVHHPRLEELAGDVCHAWYTYSFDVAYHDGGQIFIDGAEYPAGWYMFLDDDSVVPVTVYYPGSNDPVDGANVE